MPPPPPPPLPPLVFMVPRVTGHPVVPFRMIYNKIISKKHIHYPQLLVTTYKFSEIISYVKEICHFYAQGKTTMLTLYQKLLEIQTCK